MPISLRAPTTGQHETAGVKKAAASGWIGSVLEYYDFFIYASAAALVFPQLFFPSKNPLVGIAASMGTFGVAYLARPLGAIVLSHWGDRHGRKSVLVLSMMAMGFATFLVGCLPTYETIGPAAPIILVVLRLIQGFAVAGEQAGAAAMVLEHAPHGRRGYFCSFTIQGNQFGQLLAAAAFLPMPTLLGEAAMMNWGWRIPFLLSAFVVLVGYYIRRNVEETPVFKEEVEHHKVVASPLREALKNHKANMLRVTLMIMVSAINVTTMVFGMTYATQPIYGLNLSKTPFLWIPVLANLAAVILIPWAGRLSDRYGRRPVFVVGALGAGVCMYGYLYFINLREPYMAMAVAVFMWGMIYQGFNASFPAFFQELFPAQVRVTAVALPFQVGVTLTAFLPVIETWIASTGSVDTIPMTVGTIVVVCCILAAIGAWTAPETHLIPIENLGVKGALPVPVSIASPVAGARHNLGEYGNATTAVRNIPISS